MITSQQANSNPMTFTGGVFKITSDVITRTDLVSPGFAYDTGECEYISRVFAEVGGEEWKNDKHHVLVELSLSIDAVTFKLFKNDIELATITDDTYGIYMPVGSWSGHPKKASFLMDFEKILNLQGPGIYQVKADRVIISNASQLSTIKFRLLPYTAQRAKDTIRIKTFQNGRIDGGVDYTGMNFEQQARIMVLESRKDQREELIEQYRDTLQNIEQIQEGHIMNYMFRTTGLPGSVGNLLIDDMLIANSIYFTNYTPYADEVLIDIPVRKKGVESEYPGGQSLGFHKVELTDKRWIRKRN